MASLSGHDYAEPVAGAVVDGLGASVLLALIGVSSAARLRGGSDRSAGIPRYATDRRSEPRDALANRLLRERRVPEQQLDVLRRPRVVRRRRIHPDAALATRCAQPSRLARRQSGSCNSTCSPALAPSTRARSAEFALDRFEQRDATRRAAIARAPGVSFEMPFGDEVGQRELLDRRGARVRERLRVQEMRRERRRRDQPADAQRREEQLRGGARVEHAAAVVERLEALDRIAVEAELAVVVVFENVRVARERPIRAARSGAAARARRRSGTGATASRRRGARFRSRRVRRCRVPARRPARSASARRPRCRRRRSRCSAALRARRRRPRRPAVASRGRSPAASRARSRSVRRRTRRRGRARDSRRALRAVPPRRRAAGRRVAAPRVAARDGRAVATRCRAGGRRSSARRSGSRTAATRARCARSRGPARPRAPTVVRAPTTPDLVGVGVAPVASASLRSGTSPKRRDEGARAGAALRVAFRDELFAGLEHRVARDAEFEGEGARAGQAGAGLEAPLEDRRPQRAVELAVQGAFAVQGEPHGETGTRYPSECGSVMDPETAEY